MSGLLVALCAFICLSVSPRLYVSPSCCLTKCTAIPGSFTGPLPPCVVAVVLLHVVPRQQSALCVAHLSVFCCCAVVCPSGSVSWLCSEVMSSVAADKGGRKSCGIGREPADVVADQSLLGCSVVAALKQTMLEPSFKKLAGVTGVHGKWDFNREAARDLLSLHPLYYLLLAVLDHFVTGRVANPPPIAAVKHGIGSIPALAEAARTSFNLAYFMAMALHNVMGHCVFLARYALARCRYRLSGAKPKVQARMWEICIKLNPGLADYREQVFSPAPCDGPGPAAPVLSKKRTSSLGSLCEDGMAAASSKHVRRGELRSGSSPVIANPGSCKDALGFMSDPYSAPAPSTPDKPVTAGKGVASPVCERPVPSMFAPVAFAPAAAPPSPLPLGNTSIGVAGPSPDLSLIAKHRLPTVFSNTHPGDSIEKQACVHSSPPGSENRSSLVGKGGSFRTIKLMPLPARFSTGLAAAHRQQKLKKGMAVALANDVSKAPDRPSAQKRQIAPSKTGVKGFVKGQGAVDTNSAGDSFRVRNRKTGITSTYVTKRACGESKAAFMFQVAEQQCQHHCKICGGRVCTTCLCIGW